MLQRDLELFKNIPILETERLVMRRLLPADIEDVHTYASKPAVPRYLLWYPHPDKLYTHKYLKLIDKKYKRGEFYDWGLVDKESRRVIGTCGFTALDIPNNCGEIGYVLDTDFWGKGLAAEAARAVITFGFEVLSLNRIEAKFMPDNSASRRVLEKCGMTYEGIKREAIFAKGRYIDVEIYSITLFDYKKLTGKRS